MERENIEKPLPPEINLVEFAPDSPLETQDMSCYKATATVTWEFDLTDQTGKPITLARKQLEAILPPTGDFKVFVKVDKLRRKQHRIVLGKFAPDDVLPYITNNDFRREYVVGDKAYPVKMNSHRYFVFRENRKCVSCGIDGTIFLLEQHPNDKSPHFNLYAEDEDGKLVLMTKDHIYAKAHGGEDRHSNYQTMCSICNNLKGSAHLSLAGIAELYEIYKENRKSLPRKKLAALIAENRTRLLRPRTPPKSGEPNQIYARSDIHIMENENGQRVGMSVYDSKTSAMSHVACIRKGTPLKAARIGDRTIDIDIEGTIFLLVRHMAEFRETPEGKALDVALVNGGASVQPEAAG